MIDVQVPEELRIPRVTVLNGHDSEETAIFQPDYPASFRLRCQRRVWRQRGTTGDTKRQWRAMYRTTEPRTGNTVWNKPKGGNYHELVMFYANPDDAEIVETWTAAYHLYPVDIHRARLMGIVEQMPHGDFRVWRELLRISRASQTLWWEWNERVDAVTAYLREHGRVPEIADTGMWQDAPGRPLYIKREDLPVYVAVARERIEAEAAPYTSVHVTTFGWVFTYDPADRTGTVGRLDDTEWTPAEWKADKRGTAVFPADSRDRVTDEAMRATQAWLDRGARPDNQQDANLHQRSTTTDGMTLTYDRLARTGSIVVPYVEAGGEGSYTVKFDVDYRGQVNNGVTSGERRVWQAVERWLIAGAPHRPAEDQTTEDEPAEDGTTGNETGQDHGAAREAADA